VVRGRWRGLRARAGPGGSLKRALRGGLGGLGCGWPRPGAPDQQPEHDRQLPQLGKEQEFADERRVLRQQQSGEGIHDVGRTREGSEHARKRGMSPIESPACRTGTSLARPGNQRGRNLLGIVAVPVRHAGDSIGLHPSLPGRVADPRGCDLRRGFLHHSAAAAIRAAHRQIPVPSRAGELPIMFWLLIWGARTRPATPQAA